MLQETWLYPDEFVTVSQISDEFQSINMSSMSLDDKLLTGRPHGGLSIIWNKSLPTKHDVKDIIKTFEDYLQILQTKTSRHQNVNNL